MNSDFDANYQLMQSLQAAYRTGTSPRPQPDQLEDLAEARRQLLERIQTPQPSPSQRRALELLQDRRALDSVYGMRARHRISDAEGVETAYQQALLRLRQDWPALPKTESEHLPGLLLLQQVDSELQQLVRRLAGKSA